ncbi:MAG TPA: SxtJ family membrane protein [candidate division Zixibacteria bacterium]|nr:SxtJ family membrane protein [candidate division Zixibacteria bacterium]
MFSYREPTDRQLSHFGWGAALLCAALGAVTLYLGHGAALYLLGGSVVFAALTALARPALRLIYRGWMYFGMTLGWINLHLLMGVVLYVVFTPVRLIQLLIGRDPLKRQLEPERDSYLEPRSPLDPKHFERMF